MLLYNDIYYIHPHLLNLLHEQHHLAVTLCLHSLLFPLLSKRPRRDKSALAPA